MFFEMTRISGKGSICIIVCVGGGLIFLKYSLKMK